MNPLYTRHFALDEFSAKEQEKLKQASVLIVGCGGLGHLTATYLTTAGVGQLYLNDFDTVDESNLQRQFLYTKEDIGLNKATCAAKKLSQLNLDVHYDIIEERLNESELNNLVEKVDLILDCSDNFGTRFTVNRVAVKQNKPLVSGAAIRFEGQITSFNANQANPCYQCLFQESQELAEDCAGNGIFAPVTGVIASAMSVEALKFLTDIGTPLIGQLQLYEAKLSQWRTVTYRKDVHCEVCKV